MTWGPGLLAQARELERRLRERGIDPADHDDTDVAPSWRPITTGRETDSNSYANRQAAQRAAGLLPCSPAGAGIGFI
jgi:hypothetical protein